MILKLDNVAKTYNSYDEVTEALSDINLEIKEKEIVVILGPSGSGKSTLLNILSGIDTPTSGHVYYEQEKLENLTSLELTQYRKDNVGFIFQTYNLVANLTVYENIELGYQLASDPLNIDEILKLINMERYKDKYPSMLSGGEMQRVAIARALVKNSKLLFCDEPTGALDEETGKAILSLLQDINKKYHTTIIIVTHNPSVALMANTVIKMNSGKIVSITKNKEVVAAKDLRWA